MSALSRQILGCPAAQAATLPARLVSPRAGCAKPFQGSQTPFTPRRAGKGHVRRPLPRLEAMWKGIGLSFTTDPAEKVRKKYQGPLDAMNALESGLKSLTDEKLRDKTQDFKKRLHRGASVDDLLVEAFAVSPGDLPGGMALHQRLGRCYRRRLHHVPLHPLPCCTATRSVPGHGLHPLGVKR